MLTSLLRFFLVSLCLSFSGILPAGEVLLHSRDINKTDTEVRVESILGPFSDGGANGIRITIRNNTGRDRSWRIHIDDNVHASQELSTIWRTTIHVENGKEVVYDAPLPSGPLFASPLYRYYDVEATSPGLPPASGSGRYTLNDEFPTIAISQKLADRSLATLNRHVDSGKGKYSDERFATAFDPANLPTDWRSYSGLDLLLIDFDSWNTIRPASRRALLEWVRLGGRLDIFFGPQENSQFSLEKLKIEGITPPSKSAKSTSYTLGDIHLQKWNGEELDASTVVDRYQSIKRRGDLLDDEFDREWSLDNHLDEKAFNLWLILILLVAFAILVAPINLFCFAKAGRRHRLFFTTPLISIGAVIILIIFIFLGDGEGGKGYRVALVDIQPAEKERRLFVTQQQFSRTGVILNTGFKSDQPIQLDPVKTRENRFAAFKRRGSRNTSYQYTGNRIQGNLFRSRSEQGFVIRAAEPTRARIELIHSAKNGNGPVLVSNLPSSITQVYYRDDRDEVWKTPDKTVIKSGAEVQLIASNLSEMRGFLQRENPDFSRSLIKKAKRLTNEPNRFFALPLDSSSYLIPTHPGIDWKNDRVLLTGTIEPPASASPVTNPTPAPAL